MENHIIHSNSVNNKYSTLSSTTFSSTLISPTIDTSSSSICNIYTTIAKGTNSLLSFPSSILISDSTNTNDSPSSSSISVLTNNDANVPPLHISSSTNLNISNSSSSESSSACTSDKTRFLLKNEKKQIRRYLK
ncbi:unnamed protein product [Rotaria sp. Silwood1]|nr:unnamed protein product [Rotaria sp. Silwood1]CAF1643296.1 unnamed protein product [Rotaria sp. Silwood1]CAF3786299.1 unnamed protein product [Rotaria sp. Silwood1]CAF3850883.1 unnamed protein product [Rotaria sp. Silwood1]CAF3852738.1 unnamed protein product [Rotaria sp. Silwood1]